jgi:hypothetical protein
VQNLSFAFGFWDILLILSVSIQATITAYLHNPRLKALVLTIPMSFTLAVLAVGTKVGVCNVTGLLLLFIATCLVYVLNYHLKTPIIMAIILGGLIYCLISVALATILPSTQSIFWGMVGAVIATAVVALLIMPDRAEPGHRSMLPVWVKFPIIVTIIVMLVIIKKHLQGFMTVFPMVTVIAMYEARYSLWTICRQMPVLMLTLLIMMITCHITYSSLGLYGSLAAGWLAFLPALYIFNSNGDHFRQVLRRMTL